ncbi:biotin--[acetyl-CoA-carboxylase] ligase [Sulfurimonas aquatica]|uniref:Biotin--[acetyl-CoA-carboxylase] ligase n=1 Tax=Sulfurimonas aquatica TaxID=2672570 RepID=A0A975GDF5_9BACT|nr:biotin--[acetyl-CoA-carboxylase] ligase [Sulfurimonas aquatica]QSZ42264.1 biotin--[acetyl-CoA-carboxylase] ligase [Sulfurimonas aquatica]
MKTLFFKTLPSTQTYLKELLKERNSSLPIAVVAEMQTAGIGSRDNSWSSQEGNLFLSFAISIDELAKDLKLESASIYFSYILKETLEKFGSNVWLKWPNDFYIDDKKIGGMITNVVNDIIICGVGLNIINKPDGFSKLDIEIDKNKLLEEYFQNLEKKQLWKQVFSKYELQFYRNRKYFTHVNGLRISLSEASLQDDGSLNINGEKVYSLR